MSDVGASGLEAAIPNPVVSYNTSEKWFVQRLGLDRHDVASIYGDLDKCLLDHHLTLRLVYAWVNPKGRKVIQ